MIVLQILMVMLMIIGFFTVCFLVHEVVSDTKKSIKDRDRKIEKLEYEQNRIANKIGYLESSRTGLDDRVAKLETKITNNRECIEDIIESVPDLSDLIDQRQSDRKEAEKKRREEADKKAEEGRKERAERELEMYRRMMGYPGY